MRNCIGRTAANAAVAVLTCLVARAHAAELPTTARKVVLEHSAHGYQWRLTEAPLPHLGPDDVLIRVHAVSLNHGDIEKLTPDPKQPDAAGLQVASDAAGDVLAVGAGVKDVKVGERVTSLYFRNWVAGPPTAQNHAESLGDSVDGVLGDYIVLPQAAVAPAPPGLTYEEAATLPTAGLTAWMATIAQVPMRPAEVALVEGTGGVALFALQFLHARGARVIVTSSSDEKLEKARHLGAWGLINYRAHPQWSAQVATLSKGHGADLVVDLGGKGSLPQALESLAWGGTLALVGGLSGYDGQIPALTLIERNARAQGIYVGSRADLLAMNRFIVANHLRPVIDRVFAFEEYAQALEYLGSAQGFGKVILRLH